MSGRNAILFIVFLDLLGAGLVVPLLPFIAQEFGASPFMIGVFASVFPACQALAAPGWGYFADRLGRKPALILSVIGNFFACLLFVLCNQYHSLALLLISRAIAGLMSGSLVAAKAYLIDISDDETRARHMGLFGAAAALGFLIGPAIGGLASANDFGVPAWIAAGLSAFSLAWAAIALPKSQFAPRARARERGLAVANSEHWADFARLFFVTFALSHLVISFPMFIQKTFGYGARENGFAFAMLALVAIVVQGGLFGKLAARVKESRLFSAGLVLICGALFALPFAVTPFLAFTLLISVSAGFSLCNPAIMSLIAARTKAEHQGLISGVSESFASAARTLGPISAGTLMQLGGPERAFIWAGVFGLLATVPIRFNRERVLE